MITLGVVDLARSTEFYRDGLGFPVHGEYEGVTFFDLKSTWLSLYPRTDLAADAKTTPEGSGFRGITVAHNVKSESGSGRHHCDRSEGRRHIAESCGGSGVGRIFQILR